MVEMILKLLIWNKLLPIKAIIRIKSKYYIKKYSDLNTTVINKIINNIKILNYCIVGVIQQPIE